MYLRKLRPKGTVAQLLRARCSPFPFKNLEGKNRAEITTQPLRWQCQSRQSGACGRTPAACSGRSPCPPPLHPLPATARPAVPGTGSCGSPSPPPPRGRGCRLGFVLRERQGGREGRERAAVPAAEFGGAG